MRESLSTANANGLDARPRGVTTVIMDVTLLCGISVMICSGETSVKVELAAPKKTAEASCKFLPVISTREPSGPLVGEIPKISGRPLCAVAAADKVETRNAIAAIAIRFMMALARASAPVPQLSDGLRSCRARHGVIVVMNSRIGLVACVCLAPYIGVSFIGKSGRRNYDY